MSSKEEFERAVFSYTSASNDVEDENRVLKESLNHLKSELDRLKAPALMVAEVSDILKDKVIIKLPNGNRFYVNKASSIKNLNVGNSVLVEQKNLTIVDIVKGHRNFNVEQFVILEKPTITWQDIGGLDMQKRELQEVIELPLKKPQLFKKVGITPPKGVLLYGPPGTGKTLLGKAVANSTNSTFIEVVGSELIQKFIGEGAKLVKDIFDLARQKSPSIVFIDEIDALAAKRVELGTSGEREVQRTFMQFLAEIDGFSNLGEVKIIGCTNRKDILDPAILRPGRLDRLILVDKPDMEALKQIFKIHTKDMTIDKKTDIEKLLKSMKNFSGAEVKAVCTEAGYFAIREDRFKVKERDFQQAIVKVQSEENLEGNDYLRMFG
ncbi:AAA family ATPase [Candidatus Woesearchaeota archaeon]|nr:AAA family ATPase [Candidatus Woesearchaeota archaeon]